MSFVDGGYQGDEAQRAAFEASRIAVTVVKRTDTEVKGFVVLPKRWVVERTLGWINRARRLSKDGTQRIAPNVKQRQRAKADNPGNCGNCPLPTRLTRRSSRPAPTFAVFILAPSARAAERGRWAGH